MIAREQFETIDRVTVPTTPSVPLVSRRAALRGFGGAGLALGGLALAGRLASVAASQKGGGGGGGEPDPAYVVSAYVAAVNAGALDPILALYAEDAIHLSLPTADGSAGICRGRADYTVWYRTALADEIRVELVPGSVDVDGERVTFGIRTTTNSWAALGLGPLAADAEMTVAGGYIRTHVVMLAPGAVRELLAAQGIAPGAWTSSLGYGGGATRR